ncbi:MAG: response regulator, partial [Mariprofundaceae bacterium]|nr:response regulator [Mariprofundaceae bacterium]
LEVEVANNGQEAWQRIQHHHDHYDILLTDLRMPVLDGIELTKKVRSFEQEQHLNPLTIIGLSAHALKSIKDKCLDVGMNNFISKPVEADLVLKAVQEET